MQITTLESEKFVSIKFKKCAHCNNKFPEHQLKKDKSGKNYCIFCIDEHLTMCEHCYNYHDECYRILIDYNYRVFCKDCLKDEYFQCNHCRFYRHNDEKDVLKNGTIICNSCHENRFFTCNICHKEYDYSDEGDDENCRFCLEKAGIFPYEYNPNFNFYHIDDEDTKCFIGIELEITGAAREACSLYLKNNVPFVYCKIDGSIGSDGIEIVSHPATYRYHTETDVWKQVFECMKNNYMYDTSDCGLHFHISRDYFDDESIKVLDYFVNMCSVYLSKIGGREFGDYCYARRKRYNEWGSMFNSDHCEAVNLTNEKTIELRFCDSTNNYEIFMKRLKFIMNIVSFSKSISFNDIILIDKSDLFDKFKNFCSELDE